jgi:protein gp37
MADTTAISWCDSTFNAWIGCAKVSPGCDHCYAEVSTPARALPVLWGPHAERHRTSLENWLEPLRWERKHAEFEALHGRRRRVFCSSLSDVFDNQVPVDWRMDLWKLIEATPHLDWLILTKRIGIVPAWAALWGWPANAWLGITMVDQVEADRDVPKLFEIPAPVRFLSIEPMLGAIDLTRIVLHSGPLDVLATAPPEWRDIKQVNIIMDATKTGKKSGRRALDWVICGGESGPHARPMHADWARSLRDQCKAAGVPFFFKQWGEWIDASQGQCPIGPPASRWRWADGAPFRYGEPIGQMPLLCRGGKAVTGCLLDGVEHKAWPA